MGLSKEAGKAAIWKTLWTRSWALPIPLLIFPPYIVKAVGLAVSSPSILVATELTAILAMLYFALPMAIAILPPTMELDPKDLEAEFQGLKDKKGKPIDVIYANKGL